MNGLGFLVFVDDFFDEFFYGNDLCLKTTGPERQFPVIRDDEGLVGAGRFPDHADNPVIRGLFFRKDDLDRGLTEEGPV